MFENEEVSLIMKKLIFIAMFSFVYLFWAYDVSALSIEGSKEVSLDDISSGGHKYPGLTDYFSFNQVVYVKVSFINDNGTDFRVYLLYDRSAKGTGEKFVSASTTTVAGKGKDKNGNPQRQTVYFMPQDRACPETGVTCVTVSPDKWYNGEKVGTATNSRVSDGINYTGIMIQNKSLLKRLYMSDAKVIYYYGASTTRGLSNPYLDL